MADLHTVKEMIVPAETQENYQHMRDAVFTAESRYAPLLSNPSGIDSSTASSIASDADARRIFQVGETIAQIRDALPC